MAIDNSELYERVPWGQSFPVRALSAAYGSVVCARNALYGHLPKLSHRAKRPVISIGGIRAGGTGKTPVALMVGEYLLSKDISVAFLSRGYGRIDRRPRIVAPEEAVSWEAIGDEPGLLHHRLPRAWLGIDANRFRATSRLAPLLPERSVFVLDDGFQHRSLRRDIDIVCVHDSLFDDRVIPAGFLREPCSSLSRAHAVLLIGSAERNDALEKQRALLSERFPNLFAAILHQEMGHWVNAADGQTAAVLPLKNPLLVCGIARPGRFISLVRNAGISPCAEQIFPDHHRYTTNDFSKTRELYSKGVITTEKDAVRLKTLGCVPLEKLWYCTIALRFADEPERERFYSLIDTTSA
jgi:tetraacyldisaccharide 4'-kinase